MCGIVFIGDVETEHSIVICVRMAKFAAGMNEVTDHSS